MQIEASLDRLAPQLVDLAAGGFDAGVRLGQHVDEDMIAVPLTPPFPLRRRRRACWVLDGTELTAPPRQG